MVDASAQPLTERPRGAARREALLEAVLQVVAETGVEAVTHRRVAETAGLPLASTTYWFDSKEHLVCAALGLAADRDIARLQAYSAADPASSAEALDRAVAAIVDPIAAGDPAGRASLIAVFALLLEAARRPALRETSRRWTSAYIHTLSELLAAAGSQRASQDAALLLAAVDGLLIEALTVGATIDVRADARRIAGALLGES
jgi:DNA-binding transcriptional regulator YbjK